MVNIWPGLLVLEGCHIHDLSLGREGTQPKSEVSPQQPAA
jgi:hypothetical protein